MKNDKLPLKERYNNFIQKHPKFWFTLIYGVLMFTLAVAILIAVISPPKNETASAAYTPPTECPTNYLKIRFTNTLLSVTPDEVNNLLADLPVGEYRYVTAPSMLLRVAGSPPSVVTALSFRYIVCASIDIGVGILRQFYLSNSNSNPISDGMPSDAVIIATNRTSVNILEFATYTSFIVTDYNFGAIRYISELFNNYSTYYYYTDLCSIGGSCSPDDLKAEYDKGYEQGKIDGSNLVSTSPITFLLSPVSAFLEIPIWGQFSIGSLFAVVLFVACVLIFLKMFAGG